MIKKILLLLFLILVTLGMKFDTDYSVKTYNDFSGGLNLFSPQPNIKENQCLNQVNFLFSGNKLRARKGVSTLTTKLGNYPILGVWDFTTPTYSQVLACYDGVLRKYITSWSYIYHDSTTYWMVYCTQNDSTFTGNHLTNFRQYGFKDSIPIVIGDTLFFIRQILNDSVFKCYKAWTTASCSSAVKPAFAVSKVYPTNAVTWLGNEYIAGTNEVGEYDGASMPAITDNRESVNLAGAGAVSQSGLPRTLQIKHIGSNQPDDRKGWWVCMWSDSLDVLVNIPLYIASNTGTYYYCYADSSFIPMIKVAGSKVWLANYTSHIDTVDTIVLDSVYNFLHGDASNWASYVTDNSKAPDLWKYNYGFYRLRHQKLTSTTYYPLRIRAKNGFNRYYTLANLTTANDTLDVNDTCVVEHWVLSLVGSVTPKYLTIYQDCMFLSGYADDPCLVKWTNNFAPDTIGTSAYTYIVPDDGEDITGVALLPYQDVLLWFKPSHLYVMNATGETDDYPIYTLATGIGSPSQASVVVHDKLGYFYDANNGFMVTDCNSVQKFSWQIEPIVQDSINRDYGYLVTGGYFDNHLWWAYPSGTSTKNNRMVVYNIEDQSWANIWGFNMASCYVGLNESDSTGVLIGSADSGSVFIYGGSYFDGATPITALWESGWLDMGDEYELSKEFKDFQYTVDKHDSTLVYITFYRSYTDTVAAGAGDTLGVDDVDNIRFHKMPIRTHFLGQRIKVKIVAYRVDDTFVLPFFKVKYKNVNEPLYDE